VVFDYSGFSQLIGPAKDQAPSSSCVPMNFAFSIKNTLYFIPSDETNLGMSPNLDVFIAFAHPVKANDKNITPVNKTFFNSFLHISLMHYSIHCREFYNALNYYMNFKFCQSLIAVIDRSWLNINWLIIDRLWWSIINWSCRDIIYRLWVIIAFSHYSIITRLFILCLLIPIVFITPAIIAIAIIVIAT